MSPYRYRAGEVRAASRPGVERRGGRDAFWIPAAAKFTYPEFDRTLFARLPDERMHEADPDLAGWENDRAHVGRLIESIEDRDPGFLFFESAHAPYHSPRQSIRFRPFKRRLISTSPPPRSPLSG